MAKIKRKSLKKQSKNQTKYRINPNDYQTNRVRLLSRIEGATRAISKELVDLADHLETASISNEDLEKIANKALPKLYDDIINIIEKVK